MLKARKVVAWILIILILGRYKCNIDQVFSQAPECRQLIQRLKDASDCELIRILKDVNTWYYGKVKHILILYFFITLVCGHPSWGCELSKFYLEPEGFLYRLIKDCRLADIFVCW